MRTLVIATIILVAILSPFSKAESNNSEWPKDLIQQWEIDFGELYVSTQPIIVDDKIFVRTSTSSIGQGTPAVYSFDLEGNLLWQNSNSNSTMQDMSPLLHVSSGTGDCGNWSDMLLVGWSDGLFQALDIDTGNQIWQYKTNVFNWGITGTAIIDGDSVIIPSRIGLDKLCLDGKKKFSAETGLGWRNGPTLLDETYWIGDESGMLWGISENSETISFNIGEGKIRHPPVKVSNSELLIHLQTQTGSSVYQFNVITGNNSLLKTSGFSPGIPIKIGNNVLTIDSQSTSLFDCFESCQFVNSVNFQSNGEISQVFGEYIMMPHNSIEGGYGLFQVAEDGQLILIDKLYFGDDWYGTAGIASKEIDDKKMIVVVNDNANLKYLISNGEEVAHADDSDTDWPTTISLLITLFVISATSIQLLREQYNSAFKFFVLFCTLSIYFVMDDIVQGWADLVNDENSNDPEDIWNEDWPTEWLGTQVVIFEFDGEIIETGGFVGNQNVLDLTISSLESTGMSVEISDTNIGKYIVSINGSSGEGWEYYVNGNAGIVSAQYQEIDSDSIVVWKQL